ncbi:MAG: hypothetical protein IPL33_18870 [Sphingobacteriales bacterium]|nr:hypothetical protein [Sphingobacteriales bacterium]
MDRRSDEAGITAQNGGTYTVTVTAANGCTNTANATIANNSTPPAITIGTPTANTACTAPYNGAVAVTAPTGVGISYAWTGGATTAGITALNAGTYTVTVTAANGCTNTANATIANNSTPPAITIGTPTANTACTAPYNGAVAVTAPTGAVAVTAPTGVGISYAWTGGATTAGITAQNGGTYTVTVTAANGCTNTASATIANNSTPPTASASGTDNSNCTAPYNGSVNLTTTATNFIWSNGATTQNISSLNAGTYTVTVTAANGCTNTANALVSNNTPLITVTTLVSDNTQCVAPYNGSITLTSNATNFTWSNGATTQNISALDAGTYTVTAADAGGCSATTAATVSSPLTPSITDISVPSTCGQDNGSIDLTVNNMTAPVFTWSNGATDEDLANLAADNYQVTVTGVGGCSATSMIGITASSQPSINATISHTSRH